MPKDAAPNGDASADEQAPTGEVPVGSRRRVSEMQANLHRWAVADPGRRFDPRQRPWRARCGESRTPGSASGLGKRTSSNAGTAPQADSTLRSQRMQLFAVGAPVRRHDGTGHPPPVTHRQAVLTCPSTNLSIGRTTTRTRNGSTSRSP
jgi:hypothetical protein